MNGRTFAPIMTAALFGALLIAGVSGCAGNCGGSKTHCDPVACVCEPVYTTPPPYTPVPNPGNPDDWWQTVDACTLLPADTLSRLKLAALAKSPSPAPIEYEDSDCTWFGRNRMLSVELAAIPFADVGAEFPADGQSSNVSTSDGRPGKQDLLTYQGECYMAIQATSGSSLAIHLQIPPQLLLTRAPPAEHVCEEALEAANAIAPRLAGGHSHGATSPS
ncbi:hypothetical protein ABH920_006500 [Catenulispora sp. EB89]|uniref:hypothetical protein n=1 Tax=Catenulispora sp. EB89 TaxID=3156257 RepID=UPI003514F726